ncbi:MAG: DUF190 domain-containing protein [Candidatus Limnocylindrales bacterium]
MDIGGQALLVRVYVGESDQWHGQPLYHAIVVRLRELGAAGVTVLRGIEGFGAHAHLHTVRILRLSEDLPVLIEMIEEESRARRFLAEIDAMVGDGLITVERVEVHAYRAAEGPRP